MFDSNPAYLQRLIQFAQELLDAYVRVNVTIQDGAVTRVRGMSYFKEDLLTLTEPPLSQSVLVSYEERLRELKEGYLAISRRADALAAKKNVISLEYLFRIFHFGYPERIFIILSLTAELDYRFERIYSHLLDDYHKVRPTLDLCLKILFPDQEKRMECLDEVIRKKEFLGYFFPAVGLEQQNILTAPLALSRRILSFIFSPDSENPALDACSEIYWPGGGGGELPPLLIQKELPGKVGGQIAGTKENQIFYLYGEPGSGRHLQLRHIGSRHRLTILHTEIASLPGEEGAFREKMREICLEAILKNAALSFSGFLPPGVAKGKECSPEALFTGLLRETASKIFRINSFFFLLSDYEWKFAGEIRLPCRLVSVACRRPDEGERQLLWGHMLSSCGMTLGADVSPELLAATFSFTAGGIAESIQKAGQMMLWNGEDVLTSRLLHQACRSRLSHRLMEYASLVEPKFYWDDLILPKEQKDLLWEACGQILYHNTIYNVWGFSDKISYGRGLSLLFYGPPGTGKTMGAQVIAAELEMELYKIDLSAIMSKYIGETQKNLNLVFEEAKKSNGILFFDEADALFGKRSTVQDSHDKYANAETAYLLQKMEEYEGIVILATNYLQNFDAAYKRRIRFMISFPLPGPGERLKMWLSMFPEQTPVEGVDFTFLAKHFELSGSSIKNIALSAAFLAASCGTAVRMEHIVHSLKQEYIKSGKMLTAQELFEYGHLLEQDLEIKNIC